MRFWMPNPSHVINSSNDSMTWKMLLTSFFSNIPSTDRTQNWQSAHTFSSRAFTTHMWVRGARNSQILRGVDIKAVSNRVFFIVKRISICTKCVQLKCICFHSTMSIFYFLFSVFTFQFWAWLMRNNFFLLHSYLIDQEARPIWQ